MSANKEEYRPANNATVTVDVKDRQGRGAASEVTLWAVDYGVLSLTAYRTPDVLGVGLRAEGAAGADRGRAPEDHLAPRHHAEG